MTVPTDGRGPAVLEGGGGSRGRSEQQSAFNNDLSGSRLKPLAGVAMSVSMSVSQSLKLHADLKHSTGENFKRPYGVNLGLRWIYSAVGI